MAFAITFVVRGYHVYKDIWATEIGSELPCFVEPHLFILFYLLMLYSTSAEGL